MLPEVAERVLQADLDGSSGTGGAGIFFLGLPGSIEGRTATFLAFTRSGSSPLFVAKVHRGGDAEQRVRNEKAALDFLRQRDGLLAASVPEVLLADEVDGSWVLAQSVVDGAPMGVELTEGGVPSAARAEEHFRLASSWLTALHMAVDGAEPSEVTEPPESVGYPERAATELALSDEEAAALESICGGWSDHRGRLVLEHGDFSRHNLLVHGDSGGRSLNVVDWTECRWTRSPLHDLFFFLTTYFLQARHRRGRAGFVHAFEHSFFDRNPYSDLVRRTIDEHRSLLRLDSPAVEALFGRFLADRAVRHTIQLHESLVGGGPPRSFAMMASEEELSYDGALKTHYWALFLRTFLARREDFVGR